MMKRQATNGMRWQIGASFFQKVITFGTTVIIARILGPSNYGLFALALVVINSFGLFKSMGFDSALIQRKSNIIDAADTAFFIIPFVGIFLYILLFCSAPFLGKFLHNNEIVTIIRVLGIFFVSASFARVPLSLLEKRMEFAKVSIAETGGVVFFSATAIVCAMSGYGVWSLVYGYLARTVVATGFIWYFCRWRPRFKFNRDIALEMFSFGKFVYMGSILWFLKMNLDNIMVGKLLGVVALGYYAIAFNLANFIRDYIGNKILRVFFPAYSKFQGNPERLKSALLKGLKYISIVAVPFGVALVVLGEGLLHLFYGDKWLAAAGVLRILAFAGIFNSIPAVIEPMLLALGKSRYAFLVSFTEVMIFIVGIVPASALFGLKGVGLVVTFSSFVAMMISLFLACKFLPLSMREVYQSIKHTLISSALMAIVILVVEYCLIFPFNIPIGNIRFVILSILATVIYVCSLIAQDRFLLFEIKDAILTR